MALFKKLKQMLFSFGLEKQEYKLVQDRIMEDNRKKLASAAFILSSFLLTMLVLSFFIESIARAQKVYAITMLLTIALVAFSELGKKYQMLIPIGIYMFITLAFSFGIYQGVVTAPEEQTASFIVLLVAIPVWFGMKPLHMIACIYTFALIFVVCVLKIKSGYVQTSDIVNAMVYATGSAMISTYYTTIKSKRFYAEYLTERMSKTDMLTGLGNRHAYTAFCARYGKGKLPADLTLIYLDVNELKHVNDTLGHHAGDELLRGAAQCIEQVFSKAGSCYRTGGDEFIVMGEFSKESLNELCAAFEHTVECWKGSWEQLLRVSYGSAAIREVPDGDLIQLAKLADSRLYEAKALYYNTKGIDRREHQMAYRSICESYIRVLQINLLTDTCKAIHVEPGDVLLQQGASGCFSRLMQSFGSSGSVHPDDAGEYLRKTDLEYLREYFRNGGRNLHIFYRRMHGNSFCAVMAEVMAPRDYSEEKPVVYLCVKDIERQV